jgi:hypothetical protein
MNHRKFKDPDGNVHWLMQGEPKEDWVEYIEDPNMLPDPNYQPPYDAMRRNNYPRLENQLDMLWHELNTSGSISSTGEWFQTVQTVKNTHPKP